MNENTKPSTAYLNAISKFKEDDKWPDKMVYDIYCNDELEGLPFLIIEQMRDYLQSIIDSKTHNKESLLVKNLKKDITSGKIITHKYIGVDPATDCGKNDLSSIVISQQDFVSNPKSVY